MKLYHQVGHNAIWNIESFTDDKTGNGLILAARYVKREYIEALATEIKQSSFFDPQWFIPDTPKGKLEEYPFFPDIYCDGFDTSNFEGENADNCAKGCLEFQIENNFSGIIIPTRHYSGMPTDYINLQTKQFIYPFINAIKLVKESGQVVQNNILLQLILNEDMILDTSYFDNLLDWITGLEEVTGLYLIVEHTSSSKQVKNIDLLRGYLQFINLLKENELDIIIGYLNTESLILSLSDPTGITMGAYENLRHFGLRPFLDADSTTKAPNPRLYFSKLLQWVDSTYFGILQRKGFNNLIDDNQYLSIMMKPDYKLWFNKPEIYKHYFLEFSKQISEIGKIKGEKRYHYINNLIDEAINIYNRIDNSGIVLDIDSDGSHLAPWKTAANEYAKDMGWL